MKKTKQLIVILALIALLLTGCSRQTIRMIHSAMSMEVLSLVDGVGGFA